MIQAIALCLTMLFAVFMMNFLFLPTKHPGSITLDANPATGKWLCTVPKGAELKDCRQFTRISP